MVVVRWVRVVVSSSCCAIESLLLSFGCAVILLSLFGPSSLAMSSHLSSAP